MGTPARPANGMDRAVRNGGGRPEGLGFDARRRRSERTVGCANGSKRGTGAVARSGARGFRGTPRRVSNASGGMVDARGRDVGDLRGRRAGGTRRGTHRVSASSEVRGTRSGRSPRCPPAGCPRRGPGAAPPSCPRGPSFPECSSSRIRARHDRGVLRRVRDLERAAARIRETADVTTSSSFFTRWTVASGGFPTSDSRVRLERSRAPGRTPDRAERRGARALDAT